MDIAIGILLGVSVFITIEQRRKLKEFNRLKKINYEFKSNHARELAK